MIKIVSSLVGYVVLEGSLFELQRSLFQFTVFPIGIRELTD